MDKQIQGFLDKKLYNIRTSMCELFQKNKSDKSTFHNYTTLYNFLFSKYIGKEINFFEVGLGTNNLDVPSNMGLNGTPGASLYAFREYFKNANICGADVDNRILFQDDGIWTFYVDQTKPETIKELWSKFKNTKFDIIVDDGLHDYNANITFFENSIHILKPGGIYIIEDILNHQKQNFVNYFSKENNYSYCNVFSLPIDQEWSDEYYGGVSSKYDNTLAIIIK
jgi:SAM-dependent methyltransferase